MIEILRNIKASLVDRNQDISRFTYINRYIDRKGQIIILLVDTMYVELLFYLDRQLLIKVNLE